MTLRATSTSTSPTRSSLAAARRALTAPFSLEGVVRRFHQALPAFNARRLTWDDTMALAAQFGAPIVLQRSKLDAYLARRFGGTRIVVDQRLKQEIWGVFCVMHELAHLVAHPGPREFYLGSPGWFSRTETQANTVALLALAPQSQGPPYPRVLRAEAHGALMTLVITYVTERGPADLGPRWISRKTTVQRYA